MQAKWRKIQSLGLVNTYSAIEVKIYCGMLDGLTMPPMVKFEEVIRHFNGCMPDHLRNVKTSGNIIMSQNLD